MSQCLTTPLELTGELRARLLAAKDDIRCKLGPVDLPQPLRAASALFPLKLMTVQSTLAPGCIVTTHETIGPGLFILSTMGDGSADALVVFLDCVTYGEPSLLMSESRPRGASPGFWAIWVVPTDATQARVEIMKADHISRGYQLTPITIERLEVQARAALEQYFPEGREGGLNPHEGPAHM